MKKALLFFAVLLTAATVWAADNIPGLTYNSSGKYYEINDGQDLFDLANYINSGNSGSGKTFKQTTNITLTGDFPMIGRYEPMLSDEENVFSGTYDGGNFTISGLSISSTWHRLGLFCHVENAAICNVVLVNPSVVQTTNPGSTWLGAIVGDCYGNTVIDNCHVIDPTLTLSAPDANINGYYYQFCGVIAGAVKGVSSNVRVSNCSYHSTDSFSAVGEYGNEICTISNFNRIYQLTLSNCITSADAFLTVGTAKYYKSGTPITIFPIGPVGYVTGYQTTGVTMTNNEFTMPENDVTVTATINPSVSYSTSGNCGDNATWTLSQDANGNYTVLTISGTGAMWDYTYTTVNSLWRTNAPWGYDITKVTIGNGITSIGNYAFVGCQQLSNVTIGGNVTSIGAVAFDHCDGITTLNLPASVSTIGRGAFTNCVNLKRFNIQKSDGLVTLGSNNAFNGCDSSLIIVAPSVELAFQYKAATNWSNYADKIVAAINGYTFHVTNEGGTPAYAIANEEDLRNLSSVADITNCLGITFRQTANITLHGNFSPIGGSPVFRGTYDGGNYTISDLTVYGDNDGDVRNCGLFGYISDNSTVKNVRLINPSCNSSFSTYNINIGTVVGYCSDGTVMNCVVINPTVSYTGSASCDIGAIIGEISSNNCANLYFYDSNANHNYTPFGYAHSSYTVTNVARARKVTAGSNISISPAATDMAYGFVYNNETYYREGLELTLSGTDVAPGYVASFTANGTAFNGSTYTVGNKDVTFAIGNDAPDPAHFSQDGNTYTIHTATGWDVFCDKLEGGESFSGKTVKLGNDISVSRMAGKTGSDDSTPFGGTFDGDGHTLTFNYSGSEDFIAPFSWTIWTNSPVFRNLTVSGTINTTGSYAAGLVGHLFGEVTIEHCTSNVDITCASGGSGFVGLCEHTVNFSDCLSSAVIHSKGGNNSGFVGWSRASGHAISFTGCVFNGKLLQIDGEGGINGGFIGWTGSNKTVTITDCLVNTATLADGETMASGSTATFARGWNATTTATNCYYTAALGAPQCTQARSITAGEYVSVENAGTPETVYNVSGITAYPTGIKYNDVLYAGNGDEVNLDLNHADREGYDFVGYEASAGELANTEGVWTLTMPDEDVTVSANYINASVITGDVDGDGYVTTVDITAIYNYLLNGDETYLSTSDVDGDGFITTTDITVIYNILLGN